MAYAVFGFLLFGYVFGETSNLVESAIRSVYKRGYRSSQTDGANKQDDLVAMEANTEPQQMEDQQLKSAGKDDEDELLEGHGPTAEDSFLLAVLTAITALYLCAMAAALRTDERWQQFYEAFYFAYITSVTIGFGDYAPSLSQKDPATFLWIVGSLLCSGLWLSVSGTVAGQCVCSVFSQRRRDLRGVVVAFAWILCIGGFSVALVVAPDQIEMTSFLAKELKIGYAMVLICCIVYIPCRIWQLRAASRSGTSTSSSMAGEAVLSFAALGLVLSCAAVVLHQLEYRPAKQAAVDFWDAKNSLIADFRAASALADSVSSEDEVEQALSLLNSMGTCSEPGEWVATALTGDAYQFRTNPITSNAT